MKVEGFSKEGGDDRIEIALVKVLVEVNLTMSVIMEGTAREMTWRMIA